MEKNCQKFTSDTSNFSDIEKYLIKQLNTLKQFDMKPRKVIPKNIFCIIRKNNYEKEMNITS